MRILITGAGGAAAISVWKSLNNGHELYMGDIDPCAAGLYLVPPGQRLILPKGSTANFVQTIYELCKKNKIELLIPTVDVELAPLAAEATLFAQNNISLPICSEEVLRLCYDKYALLTKCQSIASMPPFTLLSKTNAADITHFPCFAKPRFGAGSAGIMDIKTAADLTQLPTDSSYLVQELLPGDEYSVDVYIQSNGTPLASVPRLRMKIDSGIAVAAQTIYFPELSALAVKIAMHVGIRYVANVQFKRALDGQYKLLEINPRFPGTLPLTAAAGIDIPSLLIKDIKGESLPQGLMPFKEMMVVRYWAEQFIDSKEWVTLCQN